MPTQFFTEPGGKWGGVQCCINGPEVRTGYKALEHWRADAINEWNTRAIPANAAHLLAGRRELEGADDFFQALLTGQPIWPNPWGQDVAATAFFVQRMRDRLTWMLENPAKASALFGSMGENPTHDKQAALLEVIDTMLRDKAEANTPRS